MKRPTRLALAGLETGVSGALAMLAWFAVVSVLYRRTVWWIPNLFATLFAGEPGRLHNFTRYTAAGIALAIFVYGVMGCLFGLLWQERRGGTRLLWTGMAVGLAVWYLLFRMLWRGANMPAQFYIPERQILMGNIIYGLMLTRFPKCASKVN